MRTRLFLFGMLAMVWDSVEITCLDIVVYAREHQRYYPPSDEVDVLGTFASRWGSMLLKMLWRAAVLFEHRI